MQRIVCGPDGESVNLRKKPEGALIDRIESGTAVEVLEEGDTWCKVRIGSRTGYMMTQFLSDSADAVAPDPAVSEPELGREDGDEAADLLAETYRVLRDLCERIESVIGEG